MIVIAFLALFLAGCSQQELPEEPTKYPNVPTYGIVLELQQEEQKWNQKK